jgi:hypothetical protein
VFAVHDLMTASTFRRKRGKLRSFMSPPKREASSGGLIGRNSPAKESR